MSTFNYITSKLDNTLVLNIQGGSQNDVTPLVIDTLVVGTDSQQWEKVATGQQDPGGGFSNFFIQNKLKKTAGNNLVADVEGVNPAPGTRVISYHQKSSGTSNQTWQFISSNTHSGYFYITSDLASGGSQPNVMTVQNSSKTPGTNVVSSPQTTCQKKQAFAPKKGAFAASECDGQLWSLVPIETKKTAFAPKTTAFAAS